MFPDLFAPNPASYLIWGVAGLLFGLLGVILVVEAWDWLRARLGGWVDALRSTPAADDLAGAAGAGPGGTAAEPWVLREPDTELRRRAFHRITPYRRAWHEGRPNEPDGEI